MAPTRTPILPGLLLAATLAAAGPAPAAADLPMPADVPTGSEKEAPAPVDRGAPPGRLARAAATLATALSPGSDAHVAGVFGPAVPWPINPIHVAVLPDGRVMNYGTDSAGKQGAGLVYDVWDPRLGTGADSHLVLPNGTATDIFCSAQTMIGATGELLITGGDLRVNGKRNYSNDRTTLFLPATNTVRGGPSMAYRRWYPTLVTLGSGQVLVLGGRQDPSTPATVPEIYTPGVGYRALPGAASEAAFGKQTPNSWWYPRGFLAPSGRVVVIGYGGALFSVDPAGPGKVERLPTSTSSSRVGLPAVMYAPGKILTLRGKGKAAVVDINGARPTVASTANVSQLRIWSSLTVLPDGKVLATGGSADANKATNVAYHAETWDPATGRWTRGASAAKPRLYHSTAVLLPDATVLTAGGGSPGPVTNLNAEVYQPPYLFERDGSGGLAERPAILEAPVRVRYGEAFAARVSGAVGRVTLLRTGSMTHSIDNENRFADLPFARDGDGRLSITPPAGANLAPPGYYMLFVLDAAGVPSVARIMRLDG